MEKIPLAKGEGDRLVVQLADQALEESMELGIKKSAQREIGYNLDVSVQPAA